MGRWLRLCMGLSRTLLVSTAADELLARSDSAGEVLPMPRLHGPDRTGSGTTSHQQPHRTAPAAPVPIGADTIGLMQIVVVGAGVMGSWTALWLRRAGHAVTLVDRHGPGNRLGSSGDESRITRSSHGTDRHYPVWQRRALDQWRELQRVAGAKLFEPAGVVWLANEAQTFEGESYEALSALGIPVERWSPDELAARVPVVNPDGIPWAMFEPEGGALFARPAVMATLDRFRAEGGEIVVGRVGPRARRRSRRPRPGTGRASP